MGSTTCVSGRCLCRTGMHIGLDGKCHSGWTPKATTCSMDTEGTCFMFGCDWSRRAKCHAASGKCLCDKNHCAEDGQCVPPWQMGGAGQISLYANTTLERQEPSVSLEVSRE